jgi:hypothetical protein
MDLFLSAQSVGMVAFITAGCMVAGGVLAQSRSRRRGQLLAMAPTETTPVEALSGGKRVLVAGTLKVEGSCCQRLEDAMPVAATTFERRARLGASWSPRDHTWLWCDRAKSLHVEVGPVRILVEGPVRVILGADELYPACEFDQLRGRVAERVGALSRTETLEAGGPPTHGVFRSVGHGDAVVIAGIVEAVAERDGPASYRTPGGGWRVRPDESGVVRIWSRRRPRVRGALGALRAYAAALVL